MRRAHSRTFAVALVLGGVLAVACSTKSDLAEFPASQGGSNTGKGGKGGAAMGKGGSPAPGGGGPGSFAGSGNVGKGGNGGSGIVLGGGAGGIDEGAGGGECGAESVEAKPVPLDLFIMLDQSGSMNEVAQGTTTKWRAVGLALGTFMNDKRSIGIGAGLQYFPTQLDVPESCTNDNQCKGKGTCGYAKVCDKPVSATSYALCEDDEACVNQGIKGSKCVPFDSVASPSKDCLGVTCHIEDYASPDVPITEIPSAIELFAASLKKHKPGGGTPTAPALAGAVKYASEWAKDHPDHKVAVVLATDGLPTQCAPINKDLIAVSAKNARPLVDTYVIGVFGKDADIALVKANLNAIAQAGAARDAFVITTGGDAAKEFADAMSEIRTSALPCDFAIPAAPGGKSADYGKVNVSLSDPDGTAVSVLYTPTAAGCDPDAGGWFYDADPKAGGKPTQVKLCPASCDAYRLKAGSKVATLFGCATVILPPPG